MSTPQIREHLAPTPVAAGSQSMTTGAGTAVNDLLVLAHGYDYYTTADMLTPTGTAGIWTLQATGNAANNEAHWKVWTRPVSTGGTQTVTVNSTPTNASHFPFLWVLDGSTLTLAVDAAAGGQGANSTSHVAPTVSPSGLDDLLLWGVATSPFGACDYTASPSGPTKSESDNSTFSTFAVFREVLSASGATGTRTATKTGAAEDWAAFTIAISGTGGGGAALSQMPPFVGPSLAATQRASW